MKKIGKATLVFVAVVILLTILAVGALMVFKPDLVRAVYDGLVLDSEQIEKKKKENEHKLANTINEFGFTMSEDDLEKINNGELSEEDIKKILLGNNVDAGPEDIINDPNTSSEKDGQSPTLDESKDLTDKGYSDDKSQDDKSVSDKTTDEQKQPANDKTGQNTAESLTASEANGLTAEQKKEYEEKTAELVAKMYALKSQYLGQIEGIVASMKAEYAALPKEQRTTASKTSIANSYLGQISALEAQCDAQVNSVVAELREVLIKSGKDTSLADAIIQAYNAEKETTKASYINRYSN